MSHAVASGHKETSQAARDVLADGGSAVDACVAAALVSFVCEPVLSQPLGGGFMMVVPTGGAPKLLDAFVQTPRRKPAEGDLDLSTVTVDFGTTTQDFHIGTGTTATPCLMQGLFEAHGALGRMPMPELAAFATRLAREGCTITASQERLTRIVAPIMTATDSIRELYCRDGEVYKEGDVFHNPALADVLEVAAIEGTRLFSEGEVAQALAAMPGTALGLDDLRRAAPRWRAPLEVTRHTTHAFLNPPPSLGGVQVALALTALGHKPSPRDIAACMAGINRIRVETRIDDDPGGARRILATDLVENLREITASFRPARRGTTHISVIDADGMGAALTISNGEGNGHVLPGTGILPNNMLGEEDLVPGGPTRWTPDQRLASMMCPTCLRTDEGGVTMLGSGGSNRIRSAITQVALNLIDHGMDLEPAILGPRMHVEGEVLNFEDTDGEAYRDQLLAHDPDAVVFAEPSLFFGGVHAVRRRANGDYFANGDPRRAGVGLVG